MALFKILKGNEANLPSDKHEGWAYVTEKGNMYVDLSNDKRVKIGSRADSAVEADRASGDKSTETIRGKYLARIKQVTSDGTQFTFRGETGDGTDAPDLVSIPLAGDKAGLVSNAAQTLKGIKTFYDGINFPEVTSTTYPAKSKGLTWSGGTDGAKIYYEVKKSDEGLLVIESTDDENAGAVFRNSSSGKEVSIINGLVTGSFKGNIEGTASNAIKDNLNQTIDETYMKYPLTISGETITMVRGDGINSTITVPDTKVTQSNTNASNYRPVVLGYTNTSTIADLSKTVRNQVYVSTKFYACPSTGVFVAPEFKGKLTGKADTAGTADYAIADGDGNNIAATYVADVSKKKNNSGAISSHYVFTVTKGDGSTNDVDLHFAASASCGGAANSANTVNVIDVRGANHLPNDSIYKDKNMQFIFNNNTMPSSDWYSGMHIAGWTRTDYQSWELVSGSSTGLNGKLYYRNGKGGSWNTWKELVFTDGTVKNAQYAEKDKDGNVITTTYIATIKEVTSNGTTFTFRGYTSDNTERPNLITIPAASTTKAGLVTNAAQTWAGKKTFTGDIIISHDCVNTMTNSSTNPYIKLGNADLSQYAMIMYTSYDSYRAPGGLKILGPDPNDPIWFEVEGDLYVKRNLYDKNGDALLADRYVASFYSHTSTASTFKLGGKNYDGDVICNHQIPNASTTVAGLITAEAQDLKGNKTLDGEFYAKGNFQRLTAGQAFYRTWMPEGTAKPIGWYRIAKISRLENYANFTLYITGGWSSGAPAVAQLQIVVQNNTVRIRQTSGIAGIIDKIRIVGTSSNNDMYLEVHQSYDYVNKGGTMSTQRFYLVGHISATTYQPTTNDGSGTAVAECPVRTYDNTYVKSGTANRMAYYSATGDISSTGHYTSTSQVGINTTNTTHIGNYSLYVEDSGAGTARFSIGDNDLVADKKVVIGSPGNRYLSFGGSGVQAYDASNKASVFYINYNGGNFQVGSSASLFSLFTLWGGLTIKGTTSTMGSVGFNYEGIGAASDNAHRVIWFAYNGRNGTPVYDNDFTYNPSTDELKVKKILISDTTSGNYVKFARNGYGYILGGGADGTISINPSGNNGSAYSVLTVGQKSVFSDMGDVAVDLGRSDKYWKTLYVNNIYLKGTTKERLMWVDANGLVNSSYHYAATDRVAINHTSKPGYNFYVNGTSYFSNLITTSYGSNNKGIKIGNTYINAIAGELILQANSALRFGTTGDWNYDVWAGLKYVHSEKTIYLGLADGTYFTRNAAAQNGGTVALPGVAYLSINGKKVIGAYDSWLRINENSAFSSGTYFGSSLVRSDNQFQVGSGGSKFYANSSGNGYFSNTLGIGAINTNYALNVYGTTKMLAKTDFVLANNTAIGTTPGTLHLAINAVGSGTAITDGTVSSLTFGAGDVAYAGIYSPSSGNYGNHLIFATTDSYAAGAKSRMTITAGGNVGIGTTAPSYKLHVSGTGYISTRLGVGQYNANYTFFVRGISALCEPTNVPFQMNTSTFVIPPTVGTLHLASPTLNTATNTAGIGSSSVSITFGMPTPIASAAFAGIYSTFSSNRGSSLTFATMLNTSAGPINRMTITPAGTVCINIPYASPTYQLYVKGKAYFSGTISGTITKAQSLSGKFYANRMVNPDNTGVDIGAPPLTVLGLMNSGYGMYSDPEFASGTNSVAVYNNSGNGTVVHARVSSADGANTSGILLRITHTGTASPGIGGFYQNISSRKNAIFAQIFRAKIPIGYSVTVASNSMGTGYSDYWVTDTAGTGKWEWYCRITLCGNTGTFSTGGHVYLTVGSGAAPSSSAPVVWYLSYCNCFDLTKGAYLRATKVYGAVWNDYAEYRRSDEEIQSGRAVIETGRGDLILATERLQPGANIVSDTFGFAIGETDKTQTPIAVSGRVLAYPYEDISIYEAGDPVCTGPNGTVSKMTREEVQQYPDRIVGMVSEIPQYDEWGSGNVKVNGRIWIKVR